MVSNPDIYHKRGASEKSCAVLVAGGNSRLLREVRLALETLDGAGIDGICIVAEADDNDAEHRYYPLRKGLEVLNRSHGPGGQVGGTEGWPGFPLMIPVFQAIGTGSPRVGIYVFPDNELPGTLDALLIECAQTSFSSVYASANAYVIAAHTAVMGDVRFKALRKPSGLEKATAGVIGNVLMPGSALSAAIDRRAWHVPRTGNEKGLNAFRGFCTAFLA